MWTLEVYVGYILMLTGVWTSSASYTHCIAWVLATMALRQAMLKSSKGFRGYYSFGINRLTHSIAIPSPTDNLLSPTNRSPQCVLPESDQISNSESYGTGIGFPCFPLTGGSMELMAVPRKKVCFLSLFIFIYGTQKI